MGSWFGALFCNLSTLKHFFALWATFEQYFSFRANFEQHMASKTFYSGKNCVSLATRIVFQVITLNN